MVFSYIVGHTKINLLEHILFELQFAYCLILTRLQFHDKNKITTVYHRHHRTTIFILLFALHTMPIYSWKIIARPTRKTMLRNSDRRTTKAEGFANGFGCASKSTVVRVAHTQTFHRRVVFGISRLVLQPSQTLQALAMRSYRKQNPLAKMVKRFQMCLCVAAAFR